MMRESERGCGLPALPRRPWAPAALVVDVQQDYGRYQEEPAGTGNFSPEGYL